MLELFMLKLQETGLDKTVSMWVIMPDGSLEFMEENGRKGRIYLKENKVMLERSKPGRACRGN